MMHAVETFAVILIHFIIVSKGCSKDILGHIEMIYNCTVLGPDVRKIVKQVARKCLCVTLMFIILVTFALGSIKISNLHVTYIFIFYNTFPDTLVILQVCFIIRLIKNFLNLLMKQMEDFVES